MRRTSKSCLSGASEITAKEHRELAVIFGEGGELAAERLS
jgi:hypothetical protein